jgi:hypothetical protein
MHFVLRHAAIIALAACGAPQSHDAVKRAHDARKNSSMRGKTGPDFEQGGRL